MGDRSQSETALVLFSGGQDSATCVAWALERFARVEMLGFDYGQRHAIELECRERLLNGIKSMRTDWAAKLGESHTLKIPTLAEISDTALTRDVAIEMGADGLPNTFVPGRNLVFLTFAAALAYRRGISHIIGGMCETDYSGYPDCRDETIKALQTALNLGMSKQFELHTPLMWLDKASTWKLANELGGAGLVDLIREHSHTCYVGERGARHDWGYGCGECPACALRAKGWREYAVASCLIRALRILRYEILWAQHDRRSVRGAVGGMVPGIAVAVQGFGRGHAFRRDKLFERRQPMPVIGLAAVGVTGRLGAPDFIGERRRPFVPREQSARVQRQRHGEGLCFPGFAKHRSVGVTGNAGHGAGRDVGGLWIKRHQAGSR